VRDPGFIIVFAEAPATSIEVGCVRQRIRSIGFPDVCALMNGASPRGRSFKTPSSAQSLFFAATTGLMSSLSMMTFASLLYCE
jgi:hypothetical protein